MENTWYVIANPVSGNGAVKRKWNEIVSILNTNKLSFKFSFTKYHLHELELVKNATEKGFRKFISVGGDGTLHNVVNGIMSQKHNPLDFKIAVIPLGTGNDWVKTYNISKNLNKTIAIIKKENTIIQDIGYIELLNSKKGVYFNNLAGLGFDGFVVNNINKYKKLGAFSYLYATIMSFFQYKKSLLTIEFNDNKLTTNSLLTLVGICQYSGGGMQLTKNINTNDGLFDISIAKNFSLIMMLLNIIKFYNGKIVNHKEIDNYKTSEIKIKSEDKNTFIQADGELIGKGAFKAKIIPEALHFIIP